MQSLSHGFKDGFCSKVFVGGYFHTLFYTISYNFSRKKLSSSNLLKKNKEQTVSLAQCCKHLSSTKYSCHPSQI